MADNGNLLDDLFNSLNQEAGVAPFAPVPDTTIEQSDTAIEQPDRTTEQQKEQQADTSADEPEAKPEAETKESESVFKEEPEEHPVFEQKAESADKAAPSFETVNGGREDFKPHEGVQRELGVTMPFGFDYKTLSDLQHAFYSSKNKPEEKRQADVLPFQQKR